MEMVQRYKGILIFVIIFFLGGFLHKGTFHSFPQHIHAWTQADRYALSLGFIENGFNFFKPSTYNLKASNINKGLKEDGVTSVDFPISEYAVAAIMKVTGDHSPFIFRIYTWFIATLGLTFLALLLMDLFSWWLVFLPLVLLVSPLFFYYSNGFIPSIAGLSFSLIGIYFLFKKVPEKRWAILFFTIAALVRTPFVFLTIALILRDWRELFQPSKWRNHKMILWSLSIVALYYLYNSYLSKTHGTIFLRSLLPPDNFEHFREIIATTIKSWKYHYFTKYQYLLLVLGLTGSIFALVSNRVESNIKGLVRFSVMLLGCGILYFEVMAQQFVNHDYYFLDSFFLPLILLSAAGWAVLFRGNLKWAGATVYIATFVLSFSDNLRAQADRNYSGEWDRGQITIYNFDGADKFLDSLGIESSQKILVIDAYSTNIPLILAKRKGYTVINTTPENIRESLTWNFDYAIMQDQWIVSDVVNAYPEIQKHLRRIAGNGRISVYVRDTTHQPLSQFLGLSDHPPVFRYSNSFGQLSDTIAYQISDSISFSDKHSMYIAPEDEFAHTLELVASNLLATPVVVVATLRAYSHSSKPLNMVCSLQSGEEVLFYNSQVVSEPGQNSWNYRMVSFSVPSPKKGTDILKIYLYNSEKGGYNVDDLSIEIFNKVGS